MTGTSKDVCQECKAHIIGECRPCWEKRQAKETKPIQARIYDQEGNLQPFNMKDTPDNRHFAEFLRVHDRYTPRKDGEA